MKRTLKRIFFIIVASSLTFIGCDKNEELVGTPLTKTENSVRILGEKIEVKNNTLSFTDENSLNKLIGKK